MIKNKFINYLFVFGLIISLVLPRLKLQGINIFPVYFLSMLIFIIWAYIFLDSGLKVKVSKKIYFPLAIILLMFTSFILPAVFFNTPIYLNYFLYDILSYLIFIPFFLFFNHVSVTEEQIDKTIFFSFMIFFIVGTLQWLGYTAAIKLYAFDSHIDAALSGKRLVLTGSDPNIGSIVAAFFIMYFLSSFLDKKSLFYFILILASVALMFKTQGRTTIIGSGSAIFIYLLFFAKIKKLYRILLVFLGSVVVIYFARLFDLFYLFEGISNLQTGENNSVNVRLDNAAYAFNNFRASPIFGWGSALEQYGSVRNIDSEFFLILQRYGLLGVIIVLSIIYSLLKTGLRYRSKKLGVFVFLMTSSLLFNILTNAVFFGSQTISIIMFLIFLTYFLVKNEKNNLPSSTPT